MKGLTIEDACKKLNCSEMDIIKYTRDLQWEGKGVPCDGVDVYEDNGTMKITENGCEKIKNLIKGENEKEVVQEDVVAQNINENNEENENVKNEIEEEKTKEEPKAKRKRCRYTPSDIKKLDKEICDNIPMVARTYKAMVISQILFAAITILSGLKMIIYPFRWFVFVYYDPIPSVIFFMSLTAFIMFTVCRCTIRGDYMKEKEKVNKNEE